MTGEDAENSSTVSEETPMEEVILTEEGDLIELDDETLESEPVEAVTTQQDLPDQTFEFDEELFCNPSLLDVQSEDLLNAFAQVRLDSAKGGILRASNYAFRNLAVPQKAIYSLLPPSITDVANGDRTSTVYSGNISELAD